MLTKSDKELILESAPFIYHHANRASELFYEILFALDPMLRPLFPDDMTGQNKKFISMIGLLADYANQLGAILPLIIELGNQHRGIGAREQDFEVVLTALLASFREIFPTERADEMIAAWTKYYRVIVAVMQSE